MSEPDRPITAASAKASERATPERGGATATASPKPGRRTRRWPVPLLVSLGLHIAIGAALTINWSADNPNDAAPQATMVVDLAAMPASPAVPPSEMPAGPQQVEAAPKPRPVERTPFDPPPQVDAALKPDFVLPLKQQQKSVEPLDAAKATPITTAPPAVDAPPQKKSAAPTEGDNAAPPSDAEQSWEGKLLARLERNKRYPAAAQRAGQQDTVFVRLVIDRKGRLVDATIKKSAGFTLLDSETLALAQRTSPFSAPPAEVPGDHIVRIIPVEFYVRKRP